MKIPFLIKLLIAILFSAFSIASADETMQCELDQEKMAAKKGIEDLAEDRDVVWFKTFGGEKSDAATSVRQTSDGGYIIAGSTSSYGFGQSDVYLIKTDSSGNEEWSKTFGGELNDIAYSAQQTSDGGYIIAGWTETVEDSDTDVYLIKTDSSGNEEWSKTFGGGMWDMAGSAQQTSDGGYIIVGLTEFNDFEQNVYLIRADSSGNEKWSKTFGGNMVTEAGSAQQTSDGGYIIAGAAKTNVFSPSDVYLVKTDSSGNEEWSKTFGGEKRDLALSVQQTTDGGYIVAGSTDSYGSGLKDFYLIKTDSSGNEVWSKIFGGEKDDRAASAQQTSDGGYIVAGSIRNSMKPDYDIYLIKTDSSGNKEWSRTFGGEKLNLLAYSIQQTTDGGYVIAGTTTSYGAGSYDILLIKLVPNPKKKPEQK